MDSLLVKPVEDETDLHRLDARSAEIKLESFLMRWSRTKPTAVVRVITGRGNRSDSGPVLQPLVRELLRGRLGRYVKRFTMDAGGGAFLLEVK